MSGYPIGSIWRKWDLHVHSHISSNGDFNRFVQNIKNSEADVIGINDYCTIDGYEAVIAQDVGDKIIFPVIEFRMNNMVLDKNDLRLRNGARINFHIIFDNNLDIVSRIKTWLNSLDCIQERGQPDKLGNIRDLNERNLLSFDYFKVIDELNKDTLLGTSSLIWLPYDEYGGIDNIDPLSDGYFKLGLINKANIIGSSNKKQIDFFLWKSERHSENQIQAWLNDRKIPCLKGSDAHTIDYPFGRLKDQYSNPIEKYCWIKANPTFMGLKQIIREPEDRVYIGEIPPKLDLVNKNKTKYIKKITIKKTTESTCQDHWFNNTVYLNHGLISIIGNKGSGKSALGETIGLLGNTKKFQEFSFFKKDKFLKNKLASNFEAILEWEDGNLFTKNLNDPSDLTAPERIKFIPQNYLEKLCTNLDNLFQQEIDNVIFSHIGESERLGKNNLQDLIQYTSQVIDEKIVDIQKKISSINKEIVGMEGKLKESYIDGLKNQIKLLKEELLAHYKNAPEKFERPKNEQIRKENSELFEELEVANKKIKEFYAQINKEELSVIELSRKIERIKIVKSKIEKFKDEIDNLKQDIDPELKELLGISFDDIIKITINHDILRKKLSEFETKKQSSQELLTKDYNTEEVSKRQNRLFYKLDEAKKRRDIIQNRLDEPTRKYQEYLDKFTDWKETFVLKNKKKRELIRNLQYIEVALNDDIKTKEKERLEHTKAIYNLWKEKILIYQQLYKPVIKFVEKEKHKNPYVELDFSADIMLCGDFEDKFFHFIDRGRKGSFHGKKESQKFLSEIMQKYNFSECNHLIDFISSIVNSLHEESIDEKNIEKRSIDDQLIKGVTKEELYDFLFALNFLRIDYRLKLKDKFLEDLSPGEKGAVLLIFYLLIDNDDIPLVIDQPEENLDNESVYYLLVRYIKEAKKRRQVVLVTHNPNLAVVCDSEQIIRASIDKPDGNKVDYRSGAIEDLQINNDIVDVLEGTMPAFANRRDKYLTDRFDEAF